MAHRRRWVKSVSGDAGYAIRVGPGTNLGQHRDGSHHHEEQHRNGAVGCHPRLEEVGNPRLCRASNQLDGDGGASIQSDVGHLVKIAEDTNQKGRIARAAAGGLSPTRVVRPEESPVMVRIKTGFAPNMHLAARVASTSSLWCLCRLGSKWSPWFLWAISWVGSM